ncbi:RND superfamily putative drug exporter/membrane protein YdfJ [Clostridium acetobutylicum]|uniref:Membrane export protein, related to SecD/SecF protein exporters n=1 Tax=Clostridium acetobutylicum (strain ATCC 824 / DSM 792 / JCM 1419 / IAM 19013 / LMG 5710 / NBRC 13948 / NRRL B-527 / VKM B-1787 / 2291 / W) TaxID=272562 RepID=Q97DP1_CLOAB|nr:MULTISPECIES: MMPL family transporter [Clostridium]AAK81361.1 Membrane export protein, related to SecD/SecF protein exporters [Clostridium acetobutylicum ATCC 824]ADZ22472.1 Membrane export protein [Clostridium acetobutylicum EA 2018]AEI33877.1 membrane export protein, SecD/SecF protein exporter [Clostridium acetobutylicum DSM 1731]AWV80971.1 MMPL family transporter [Clostridium acetobutylicum]MBC2393705.1 MMPL family transporter [Clostridium acetobutylicum]
MAKLLYNLGSWVYKRPKRVIVAWVVFLAILGVAVLNTGIKFSDNFSIPGSKSEKAGNMLKKATESQSKSSNKTTTIRLIFKVEKGKDLMTPSVKIAINKLKTKIQGKDKKVMYISDPYAMGTISKNKKIAYADITYNIKNEEVTEKDKNIVFNNIKITRDAGIQTELGGDVAFSGIEAVGPSDAVGLAIAFIVLLITFRLFMAALMPIATAAVGLASGVLCIFISSNSVDTLIFSLSLAAMIGLAVGIDYALFIISRYRENLAEGYDRQESLARAMATAGSSVLFAGVTVIIALSGLSLVGVPFLRTMGLDAAAVVLLAIISSLTAVPAFISIAKDRISIYKKNKIFNIIKSSKYKNKEDSKWGSIVSKHPAVIAIAVVIVTALFSYQALNLELGIPDKGSKPIESTERKGYDIMAEGFGKGVNGPLILVADASKVKGNYMITLQEIEKEIGKLPNIKSITPPIPVGNNKLAMINLVPKSGPNDKETKELVKAINEKSENIRKYKKVDLMETGATAVNIDTDVTLSKVMPKFILVIVGLAIILMVLVFRSILVPIKAVLGFLMTILSTLGFGVIVLQNGHLAGLFNVAAREPILCFLPILVTGILFGLAMDYEVFLVSRMRESYTQTGDARKSVILGIKNSGKVVTSAALIMTAVFLGFAFNVDANVKEMGITLAFGVLFDAFVIRMTFVPAVMILLGKKAWYMPKWLDRILPNIDIEGESIIKEEKAS